MSNQSLTELIDICCAYFDGLGFRIEELPRLDGSLEWRPHFTATRERHPSPDMVAFAVRENGRLDAEVLIHPLREARQILPNLPIFLAVPPLPNEEMQDVERTLSQIGVGIYVVDGEDLRRIRDAAVPFQADRRAVYPIRPDTEYRNRANVRKMLFRCNTSIDWLDKHFTIEGFDILHDHMSDRKFQGMTQVRILTGPDIVDARFRREYRALTAELNGHSISLACRTIDRADLPSIHDRYVIAPNIAFNVLPVRSLIRGQTGELVETDTPADFLLFWNRAGTI